MTAIPHLDPHSYASQILWLVVSFGIFYLFVARILLINLQRTISFRANHIELTEDNIQNSTHEYEKLDIEYRELINKRISNAHSLFVAINRELKNKNEMIYEDLNKNLHFTLNNLGENLKRDFIKNKNKYSYLYYNLVNQSFEILQSKYFDFNNF